MAYPPHLRQQANEMRQQGALVADIAAVLGVSEPTVVRWTNPELEARDRARARKKKYSQRKRCASCRRRVSNNGTLCRTCYRERHLAERPWPRERVIEAIRQWAEEYGYAPAYSDWQRSGKNNPALSSILKGPNPVFRNWSEALREAGYRPKVKRIREPDTWLKKKERATARRLVREEKIKRAVAKGEQ